MARDQEARRVNDCVFCRIIEGKIPSAKVFENDKVIAFLDIMPANKGHILVVSKKHVERVDLADDETFCVMAMTAQKLVRKMMDISHVDGYNILVNNGDAAGQEVKHLHMHLIPRYRSDPFKFHWPPKKYGPGEMERLAKSLKIS